MGTKRDALTTSTSTTEDSAVREIVARASDAQNEPDTFLSLHTSDTIVVNVAGRRVLGRDALAQAMKAALASPLSHVTTSVEVIDVRFPAADVAVISCIKTLHDGRADTDQTRLPETGSLSYVMTRTADGWRIAHAQTTPIVV
jgi:uncharacterized protein (TIGR02246 family)